MAHPRGGWPTPTPYAYGRVKGEMRRYSGRRLGEERKGAGLGNERKETGLKMGFVIVFLVDLSVSFDNWPNKKDRHLGRRVFFGIDPKVSVPYGNLRATPHVCP
jgi:hypothetical protein